MVLRLGSIVLLVAAVASASQLSSPLRVSGPGYDGVIIGADARDSADLWTPAESIVREAEALLPTYLDSPKAAATLHGSRIRAELPHYKRQYWGVVRRGQREIAIHFYHQDSFTVRGGSWLRGRVAVMGGGDHFFQLTYRVQDRRFSELHINAPE
jgi:hypothetical protein